jgi:hypothetical protein
MNTTAHPSGPESRATITASIAAFILKHPIILAWIVGIFCAGMTGCSSPTEPTEAGLVRPGIGSTFIYKVTRDSTGTPNVHYDTMVVTRTGLRIGGRTDVVEIRHEYDKVFGYQFTYLSYDTNHDVRMVIPAGYHLNDGDTTTWSTYPVGSRTSKVLSVQDDSPYADYPTIISKSDYTGSESIAVGSERLVSHKISTIFTFITATGGSVSDERRSWFAPSVGNFTRLESSDYGSERRELLAYSLKP